MIYTQEQLVEKINQLRVKTENEVVEWKEAKSNFPFKELGQYFSALSNEANLRGQNEGWLFFGIADNGNICGTAYRLHGGLQDLKREIAQTTSMRITFIEIYDVKIEGKRVVAFQIPPAIRGLPTTYQNACYAREHESICPLPADKYELIRNQSGADWSKEFVPDAELDDLDPEAISKARGLFIQHQSSRGQDGALIADLSDTELLNKIGLTIKGRITRTALLLLGKRESAHYFDGFIPRITWTLYNADGSPKTYEHFDMPLLLAVDDAYSRIRNVKYRYIAGQQTLFPNEVDQYSPDLLKEVINNCLAHQDYRLNGKINIGEYEDHLVFQNEGGFIPETIERAIAPDYKAPYYRNTFLCAAMVNLYMIDTNSMGIPGIYKIQRDRYFPLPTYDLSQVNRVKVIIYGKILDASYTRLLCSDSSLDMGRVFLLDKVQKGSVISPDEYQDLKRDGLVEGRYPNLYVSYEVAEMVGQTAKYIKNKGLNDEACIQFILNALKQMECASKQELFELIENILPAVLSKEQKRHKTGYLLKKMQKNGQIYCEGKTNKAKWHLSKT